MGTDEAFDPAAQDVARREALRDGVRSARERIAERAAALGASVNGWVVTDAFGDRGFFAGDHLFRAAGAMAGWGGNDRVEAVYPLAREDGDGRPLDGAGRYELRLGTPPPTRAFWSVTMYDTSYDGVGGYLIENPIDRYLVNSTTPGLARGPDGSLAIRMQHGRPDDPAAAANWLPSPDGAFDVVMRIYWPEAEVIDGGWEPPAITRLD